MEPKWVVVEGPDKVGKTTLSKRLHASLPESIWTREPGSEWDDICVEARKLLFRDDLHMDAELHLFMADRIQHEMGVVIPALGAGHHVIQDRGLLSTYIFQVMVSVGKVTQSNIARTSSSPDTWGRAFRIYSSCVGQTRL